LSIRVFEWSPATKTEGNARHGMVYDIRIRAITCIGEAWYIMVGINT
jgi:hypothetical protein